MNPIIPANLGILTQHVQTVFQDAYASMMSETLWDKIATKFTSGTADERYVWAAQVSKLREWIGERQYNNLKLRGQVVENKTYEGSVAITRDQYEDEQYGQLSAAVKGLARECAFWPDDLVSAAVELALTATCFDGQPFFDAAHPIDVNKPALGTYSNKLSGCALTAGNYGTARAALRGFKGEDGRPLSLGRQLLLMVPTALEATGKALLEQEYIAQAVGGNSGSAMAGNVWRGTAALLVNPYLTSSTRWYLLSVGEAVKPFLFQERTPPAIIPRVGETDSNVFELNRFEWGVRCRGAASFTLPLLALTADA